MLVEQRTYSIVPGKLSTFTTMYQSEGLRVQLGHLGTLLGYYTSEFGLLNQVVHLWGYQDLEDRETRRAALFADPKWLTYFDKVIPLVLSQQSVILKPLLSITPVPAHIIHSEEESR